MSYEADAGAIPFMPASIIQKGWHLEMNPLHDDGLKDSFEYHHFSTTDEARGGIEWTS